MKKWILTSMIGTGAAVIGAGITTAATLPLVLKLKKGIEGFVPNSGSANWSNINAKIEKGEKINYVAIGDSVTAGYNGFLGRDALSYADFLANDFRNKGVLGEYYNFGVSGAITADTVKSALFNPGVAYRVANADVISISIGANDLLHTLKLSEFPFAMITDMLMGGGSVSNSLNNPSGVLANEERQNAFEDLNSKGNWDPKQSIPSEDLNTVLLDTIKELNENMNDDSASLATLLNIDEKYKDIIFDLIKRNIMTLIHDLHEANPDAQIMVLGYAMPFAQWPNEFLDAPNDFLWGKSINELFRVFLNSIKESLVSPTGGSPEYANYIEIDTTPIYRTSLNDYPDGNKIFDDYIKHDQKDVNFAIQNAMPNAMDIHPSQFGHELIGNSLYSFIFNHMGWTGKAEDNYTFSESYDPNNDTKFERNDENPEIMPTTPQVIVDLLSKKGMIYNVLKTFMKPLSEVKTLLPLVEAIRTDVGGKVFELLISSLNGKSDKMPDNILLSLQKIKNEDGSSQLHSVAESIHQWMIDQGTKDGLSEDGLPTITYNKILALLNAVIYPLDNGSIAQFAIISNLLSNISTLMGDTNANPIYLDKIHWALQTINNSLSGNATDDEVKDATEYLNENSESIISTYNVDEINYKNTVSSWWALEAKEKGRRARVDISTLLTGDKILSTQGSGNNVKDVSVYWIKSENNDTNLIEEIDFSGVVLPDESSWYTKEEIKKAADSGSFMGSSTFSKAYHKGNYKPIYKRVDGIYTIDSNLSDPKNYDMVDVHDSSRTDKLDAFKIDSINNWKPYFPNIIDDKLKEIVIGYLLATDEMGKEMDLIMPLMALITPEI